MKSKSPTRTPLYFCCIILCCAAYACKPPVKNPYQSGQAPALKTIERDILLNLVKRLAENMSARHCDVAELNKILKNYTSRYKINSEVAGKPFNKAPDYLSIYFDMAKRDSSKISFCTLLLPKPLYKAITFNSLKAHFGDCKKVPLESRPFEAPYIITSFIKEPAPGINISVESKGLPESLENSVEKIELSPKLWYTL